MNDFLKHSSSKYPSDWNITNIGNVSNVIRGASPRPQGDPRYYGGSIPRLMGKDVNRDGKFVTPKLDYLTEEGAAKSRFLPAGSLVMICSGEVGVPAILAIDACIHDGFLAFQNISHSCNKEYLYYIFDSSKDEFNKSATHGGIFTNLTTSIIKEFKIPLPPLPEQQKIAEILSTVDEKIEVIEAQINQTTELKKGLMQQLLTKGIGHTKFKDSPLGKIPESWDVVKLGNLIKIKHGFAFEGNSFTKNVNKNLLITPGNFKIEGGIKFDWDKQKFYNGFIPNEYILKTGDLIIALTDLTQSCDILGSPALIPDNSFNYLHNQRIGLVSIQNLNTLSYQFLYHYMNLDSYRFYLKSTKTGTTVSHTSPKTIYESQILIPPIEEQVKIAEILSKLDEKLNLFALKRTSHLEFKKGLMQQLLTGKLRVNLNPTNHAAKSGKLQAAK